MKKERREGGWNSMKTRQWKVLPSLDGGGGGFAVLVLVVVAAVEAVAFVAARVPKR